MGETRRRGRPSHPQVPGQAISGRIDPVHVQEFPDSYKRSRTENRIPGHFGGSRWIFNTEDR